MGGGMRLTPDPVLRPTCAEERMVMLAYVSCDCSTVVQRTEAVVLLVMLLLPVLCKSWWRR